MIPAIPIAYIEAACILGPFVAPFESFAPQWPLFLAHGAFIGPASCLLALGPSYIRSSEVVLLVLLESLFAPILVWAVIKEDPWQWAIAGGAIVIGALLISNTASLARQKSWVIVGLWRSGSSCCCQSTAANRERSLRVRNV